MRRLLLLPLLLLVPSCSSAETGDARLARQAALGMTIEHQALRLADRLLDDAIDCSGPVDDNAAAIAAMAQGNLGSCAEVTVRGAEVDVVTGASCDFGERVFASLEAHVRVAREGSSLVVAIDLPRARVNGLDAVGTVTLRSADCGVFDTTMDLASNEYTVATPAGASLRLELSTDRATLTGPLGVVALGAAPGERNLELQHDATVFGAGECWFEGGGASARRDAHSVTFTFDATTTMAGIARIDPGIDGSGAYALPEYGPCPDRPRG